MAFPPLANLLLVRDRDAKRCSELARSIRDRRSFSRLDRPTPSTFVALDELPGGPPEDEEAISRGLLVTEGRQRLSESRGPDWFRQVIELVDHRPQGLVGLPGDFSFVRVRSDGSVSVVSSCAGLVPLYVYQDAERLIVSTRMEFFAWVSHTHFMVDPLVNAMWGCALTYFPDGRAFIDGVSLLGPGTVLTLPTAGRPQRTRYWRPEGIEPSPADDHGARLRELLISRLAADLDPAGENLLTLSGGADSTSLAYLVTGLLGRSLSSLSLLPSPPELHAHELAFIEPTVADCGLSPAHRFVITQASRLSLLLAAPAIPFPIVHPALVQLPTILAGQQVRVMVGGEFADEVCGQSATIGDWALGTSLRRLLLNPRQLPFGPRDYLRWPKHRLYSALHHPIMPLPQQLGRWVRADVRAEYSDWRRRFVAQSAKWPHPAKRQLAARARLMGYVPMNWEATSRLGIRRSFPFFNRECLELAYSCPPSELLGPGTKKLLKAALGGDVPKRNLDRRDGGGWGSSLRDHRVACDGRLPETVERVVDEDYFPSPPGTLSFEDARGLWLSARVAGALRPGSAPDHLVLSSV